jgi:hypothetical protein
MVIAFSYGKVDHDRLALLVALAVLPTVGRARASDLTPDERAGWALRCIQLAVVATSVLAVGAKLRFGGLEWVGGATLVRAVVHRGTPLAEPLMELPWVLQAAQAALVALELSAPLMLVRGRVGRLWVAGPSRLPPRDVRVRAARVPAASRVPARVPAPRAGVGGAARAPARA